MQHLVEWVSSHFAFFPPSPPTYKLEHHRDGAQELYIHSLLPGVSGPINGCRVLQLDTRRSKSVVAAHIFRGKGRPTVLFSHGNAVDLGQMLPHCKALCSRLNCNMLCYDYSGYGMSYKQEGEKPSVSDTYADIDACYQWLLKEGTQPHDIILYGQSVGSGPTVHLAARTSGLAGIILHSPISSGMRVLKPNWSRWPEKLDVYTNAALIGKVDAPALIIHGTADSVVPIEHGQTLHRLCKQPSEPLWASGHDHDDVELSNQYLPRLQAFLKQVRHDNS
ncbi:hypothetical protein WJX73_000792 [Symbiochloris irregularis]|uniref:Serine aminopeptidase S33 domain-containing protein n=1 Tax=Symbiochloris irregularis TaxID=706552 RepID=A0AAW1NY92_9CHLO